ncbi:MAG: hypothetical protein RL172_3247 [Bacteroidota bacterium]
MTLAQQIQQKLNYPPLQAIDAATDFPADESSFDALSQSAVISFLAAVYKATRTREDCEKLLQYSNHHELIQQLFGNTGAVYQMIKAYTGTGLITSKARVTDVAAAYLCIINDQLKHSTDKASALQSTLSAERDTILKYIPARLQLGQLLHDETIDDNSNKMHGPVSSLLHKIENSFSAAD